LFLYDCRIVQPEDDVFRVAVLHFGFDEIRTGFFYRYGNRRHSVEVFFGGFEIDGPLRNFPAEIFLTDFVTIFSGDELIADLLDLHPLPIELSRLGFEIILNIVQ